MIFGGHALSWITFTFLILLFWVFYWDVITSFFSFEFSFWFLGCFWRDFFCSFCWVGIIQVCGELSSGEDGIFQNYEFFLKV
jgi:hypothetical protein